MLDKLVPGLAYLRGDMQIAQMVHGVASLLMMALFCGHIYLGTVGMKGAYDGMVTGYVDEAWAKDHHGWWHDDIKAGKIPAIRTAATPPGDLAPSGLARLIRLPQPHDRGDRMKRTVALTLLALAASLATAKLPAPSDEAKAKSAEAAAIDGARRQGRQLQAVSGDGPRGRQLPGRRQEGRQGCVVLRPTPPPAPTRAPSSTSRPAQRRHRPWRRLRRLRRQCGPGGRGQEVMQGHVAARRVPG